MRGADVPLCCRCGQVQGTLRDVRPATTNRVVCYCKFCRGYARRLMPEVLDADGGCEIMQMSPANLEFTAGEDQIVCGKLTSKGPLRWHTRCCSTPIANTLAHGKMPFMGLVVRACLELPEPEDERAALIGPVQAGVNHAFTGEEAARRRGTRGRLVLMLARFARMMLGWRLKGDHKRAWFFDPKSLQPRVEPFRFPKEELG